MSINASFGDSLQNICVHKTKIYQSTTVSKTFLSIVIIAGCCFVQNGNTALMMAASRNHIEVVGLLLKLGADVNAKNNVSFHVDILDMLLFICICLLAEWKHSPVVCRDGRVR